MRFAAIFILALAAAPAVAQQTPAPKLQAPVQAPPPEGFYRNTPNAYDLLHRMQPWTWGAPILIQPCSRPAAESPTPEEKAAYLACTKKNAEALERLLQRQREPQPNFRLRPAQ